MKSVLLLLFSCKVLFADNPVYILPERVRIDYPDKISLNLEADDLSKVGSLSITIGKKKIVVDAGELVDLFNPDPSLKLKGKTDDKEEPNTAPEE
ncbi:MAG: hypothetical protein K9N23_07110 [Akkermansiaceae bacterium]|nr:hypothetical protein [Akkermansiaceae bacterium]MCF7731437.1 hypothetical protein [Akkermansiaceae bacterium]